MQEENYNTLLDKIKDLENKLQDNENKIQDVVNFNKTLLSRKQVEISDTQENNINKKVEVYINECKNNK